MQNGRLEALRRCGTVLLVLSPGYLSSPEFASEHQVILSRLLETSSNQRSANALVLRFSPDPKFRPPVFPLPTLPADHPLHVMAPWTNATTAHRPLFFQVREIASVCTEVAW